MLAFLRCLCHAWNLLFGIPSEKKSRMPDSLRITVDEVRKRMEAGEDFVLIDTRNPQAWSQSDVKLPRLFGFPWRTLTKAFPRFLRTSPLSRTAPDRTSTLAPIWRKNLRQRGDKNAWALQDGLDAWRNASLSLDSKPNAA